MFKKHRGGFYYENDELLCDCDVIHADVVQDVKNRMPDINELYELSDFSK